jgi:hypothetical protein
MTYEEKCRAWRDGRSLGRERSLAQTMALELLAERKTISLYEAANHMKVSRANANMILSRLAEQKLAVCIRVGTRGNLPTPSIWQIREAFERTRTARGEIQESLGLV